MLHEGSVGYPSLRLKAYNDRVFVLFLKAALETARDDHKAKGLECWELAMASAAAAAVCAWFSWTERCSRYLKEEDAAKIEEYGCMYLRCYAELARHAAMMNIRRWRMTPKMHASCMHI